MSNVILPLTGPQSSRPPVPLIDLVEQYETIQGEIRDAVERVFATQRFVLGDEVAEFECDVAAFCDAGSRSAAPPAATRCCWP